MTFGSQIRTTRERLGMTQRELASRIRKVDGEPISAAYLHDLELDRRNPPHDLLLEQIATALQLPREVLYYYARRLPPDLIDGEPDPDTIVRAYAELRRRLDGG